MKFFQEIDQSVGMVPTHMSPPKQWIRVRNTYRQIGNATVAAIAAIRIVRLLQNRAGRTATAIDVARQSATPHQGMNWR